MYYKYGENNGIIFIKQLSLITAGGLGWAVLEDDLVERFTFEHIFSTSLYLTCYNEHILCFYLKTSNGIKEKGWCQISLEKCGS